MIATRLLGCGVKWDMIFSLPLLERCVARGFCVANDHRLLMMEAFAACEKRAQTKRRRIESGVRERNFRRGGVERMVVGR